MRLPNNCLHISTARAYGAIPGLEFEGIEELQGCPSRYMKYIHKRYKEPMVAGPSPLVYGRVIHQALYLAEREEVPLLPDALAKSWDTSLPPEMYVEAEEDLSAFLEKGGLDLTCVYVEKSLKMPLMEWNGKPYTFGGRLDWIGLDPTDDNTIWYCDYKSNRSPMSQVELEADVQFTGYSALIRANITDLFPGMSSDVRIVGILEQLKFNTMYVEKTDEEIDVFIAWAVAVANRILEDKKGKPRLNRWCGNCTDRWECPAWKGLPGEGETLLDRMAGASTLLERVEIKHRIEKIRSSLDKAVDAVKEELIQSPGEYDGINYEVADKWQTVTDMVKLHEALGVGFYGVVKVVQYLLDSYAKKNPRAKPDIKAAQERQISGVKLAKKKLNNRT